ncbi:hypothetical protein EB796_016910 [Bugula neritina]|uniref:Apple domain-containing protein n=1 Tax=Bugula neritina TaxID=10212 RepID=A0A7J7JGP3_BUGNE|nr:hypothetical protein EB796_016910 [Bugula neritina]
MSDACVNSQYNLAGTSASFIRKYCTGENNDGVYLIAMEFYGSYLFNSRMRGVIKAFINIHSEKCEVKGRGYEPTTHYIPNLDCTFWPPFSIDGPLKATSLNNITWMGPDYFYLTFDLFNNLHTKIPVYDSNGQIYQNGFSIINEISQESLLVVNREESTIFILKEYDGSASGSINTISSGSSIDPPNLDGLISFVDTDDTMTSTGHQVDGGADGTPAAINVTSSMPLHNSLTLVSYAQAASISFCGEKRVSKRIGRVNDLMTCLWMCAKRSPACAGFGFDEETFACELYADDIISFPRVVPPQLLCYWQQL